MSDIKTTIRAFFAIDLPKPLKEIIFHQIIAPLGQRSEWNETRWSRKDDLHITLQFIAALNTSDIPKIIEGMRSILLMRPPFDLTLGPLEFFPDPLHPNILSLSVKEENGQLTSLAKDLGEVLHGFQYPKEKHPFRGHLTLGRLRTTIEPTSINKTNLPILEKLRVEQVVLFESRTGSNSSHYISMAQIKLHPDSS